MSQFLRIQANSNIFLVTGSHFLGFPDGACDKELNAVDKRDVSLIPGSGISPGGGNGSPLQYSCLENPMDRGAWWVTVHRVTELHATEGT